MNRSTKSELQMLREVAWFMLHQTRCFFCKDPITKLPPDLTFGHRRHPPFNTEVTLHHLDENRQNNSPSNLAWAHTSCHRSYHAKQRALKRKEEEQREEETQKEEREVLTSPVTTE